MTIPVRRARKVRGALIVITHTYMTIPVRRARKARGALIAITHTHMTIPRKIPLRGPLREHDSPHLPPLSTPMAQEHIPSIHSPSPISQPQQNKAIRQQKNKKNDKKFARFKKKPYLCIRNHQDCDFHQVNIGLVAQLVRATDS